MLVKNVKLLKRNVSVMILILFLMIIAMCLVKLKNGDDDDKKTGSSLLVLAFRFLSIQKPTLFISVSSATSGFLDIHILLQKLRKKCNKS